MLCRESPVPPPAWPGSRRRKHLSWWGTPAPRPPLCPPPGPIHHWSWRLRQPICHPQPADPPSNHTISHGSAEATRRRGPDPGRGGARGRTPPACLPVLLPSLHSSANFSLWLGVSFLGLHSSSSCLSPTSSVCFPFTVSLPVLGMCVCLFICLVSLSLHLHLSPCLSFSE